MQVALPDTAPFHEYDNERFLVDYLSPYVTSELKWRLENIITEEEMLDIQYNHLPKYIGFASSDLGLRYPTSVIARNKNSIEFLFLINHINQDGIHFFIVNWYFRRFMNSGINEALRHENFLYFLDYLFNTDRFKTFETYEIAEEPYDVSLDAEWIGKKNSATDLFNEFISEIFTQ